MKPKGGFLDGSDTARLTSGDGEILVAHGLQGRIFCRLGGRLIHQFDEAAATGPVAPFNNVGGNSLWPGPEGGPFAFNYPSSGEWRVQEDLNRKPTRELDRTRNAVTAGKCVSLVNRGGVRVDLDFRRHVSVVDPAGVAQRHGLLRTAYRTLDELSPVDGARLDPATALFCAWSLEQFPATPGTVAFGLCRRSPAQINTDYYGDPGARLRRDGALFRFEAGGPEKFQIGLSVESEPELIGAYDPSRGLLILRRVWAHEGLYFNIADNDQPAGPHSARDLFSLFNGGPLGFYELETIAPLNVAGGEAGGSRLWSETLIFQGPPDRLLQCLETEYSVPARFLR